MMVFILSSCAMTVGFVLDMIFGDPYNFPHIVRFMGKLITAAEKVLRRLFKSERGEIIGGLLLVVIVTLVCTGFSFALLFLSYRYLPPLGFVTESFLCYQLLAAKSLKTESMKVYHALQKNDTEAARYNVSMIVGRDTKTLDDKGITQAAVETVAENTSDGVTAPIMYIMLGGAVLGCLYKAVNTMDSMVGYKNEKYLHFGRVAARLDDILNYIPSRICALLMIISAFILGFDVKNAYRIWRRDRYNHASPNSAQTESVCAGALGIRLAGPASYFGVVYNKPYIGDNLRDIQSGDIVNANRLMYCTAFLSLLMAVLFRILCLAVVLSVI